MSEEKSTIAGGRVEPLVMSTAERVLKCGDLIIASWRDEADGITFDINHDWLNRRDSERLSKDDMLQLAIALKTVVSDAEDCRS